MARHRKLLRSRAFMHGVASGFSSMFLLSLGRRGYHYKPYDTVEASWREVGSLLKEATKTQGRYIEQAAKQKAAKPVNH